MGNHNVVGDEKMKSTDIYIYNGVLQEIHQSVEDVTGIPPESSLIAENVWKIMCEQAGDEASLIASIPATDIRGDNDIRC